MPCKGGEKARAFGGAAGRNGGADAVGDFFQHSAACGAGGGDGAVNQGRGQQFEAFNRLEAERGLPHDLVRTINATNPHDNAWALLERSDITPDQFDKKFAAEAAEKGNQRKQAKKEADLNDSVQRVLDEASEAVADAQRALLPDPVEDEVSASSAA